MIRKCAVLCAALFICVAAASAAPELVRAEQLGSQILRVVFSEPVAGADEIDAYSVTDSEGGALPLTAAAYDEAELAATLTLTAPLRRGTVRITFVGITDTSPDGNRVEGSVTVDVVEATNLTQSPKPAQSGNGNVGGNGNGNGGSSGSSGQTSQVGGSGQTRPAGGGGLSGEAVVLLLALVALLALVIGYNAYRSKKERAASEERRRRAAEEYASIAAGAHGRRHTVRLRITAEGAERDVEIDVAKKFTVGSAGDCTLRFDDAGLRPRHFEIGADEHGFYLENLDEGAETFINGALVEGRRRLVTDDIVKAGGETLVFLGRH